MILDIYFEMGNSHEVCQDYALTDKSGEIGFAIVTDGCSESHTYCGQADLGARVVAYSARKALMTPTIAQVVMEADKSNKIRFSTVLEQIRIMIMDSAEEIRNKLDLSPLYSDCTLLMAVVEKNKANLFMFGDGCASVKFKNGDMSVIDVSYLSGAPYYPSYPLDANRLNAYVQEFGSAGLDVRVDNHLLNGLKKLSTNQVKLSPSPFIGWENTSFTFNDIESISIMSDGVKSYGKTTENNDTPVTLLSSDVINNFVSYKNTMGVFVQRRMKVLKKEYKKQLIEHYDDISVATIVV